MTSTIDALTTYAYDAVIVLGMNIRKTDSGYRPTTYTDHDAYGMLAGEMNVIAATLLFGQGVTQTFLFSTGTSEKTKAAFGPDVPTEAEVYSQDFLRRLGGKPTKHLEVILENKSVNTYTNLTECMQIIGKHPEWKRIAIMSARYHIPRIEALWNMASSKHSVTVQPDFLVAEDVIEHFLPGIYTQQIQEAYNSPEGLKRVANEIQGLQDMHDGKYVVTEFQLSQQPKSV
jgi:DUF218 domain